MKKSQLKGLIKQIIKEALIEQPVGGVKNDHPFDDGRHNVMKAVNVGEMVGSDGRYQDDMESGVAVKKLHNLDEESYKQKFIYPEKFKIAKNYIRVVRKPETNEFVVYWYENGKRNEDKSYFTDDIKDAIGTFEFMKKTVDKANSGMNETNNLNEIDNWKEIDSGFFEIPENYAKKLSGGQLPRAGYEKLVPAPAGFKTENGFVWLSPTKHHEQLVWSIRDSKGWKLENGIGVLSSRVGGLEEMTSTGAVAGYSTPFAFSKKNKQGSSKAIKSAKKYGTVVKSISETEK